MAKKQRSFILRIWLDDSEQLYGQVSDPHSNWRHPFHTMAELWDLLSQAVADLPVPPSSLESSDEESST